MLEGPMEETEGLLHFTDGALAYAGRSTHEDGFPTHTHSFVEIAVALGGHGLHHSTTGRERLRRGDVVLLRPGVWHGYEDCERLTLYNCCFSAELLHRELAWTREDPMLGYLLWTGPHAMGRRGTLSIHLEEERLRECLVHLEALGELGARPVAEHRGDVIGRLSLVLGQLARAVPRELAGPTHPAVVRAMRLMEAEVSRPWTLSELAGHLHLTQGYLVRLFRSATGLPPMAYLARLRVETAATLLLRTGDPIAHIGAAVGWGDQNYFARRFRAHFGMSASAYRQSFAHQRADDAHFVLTAAHVGLSPPEGHRAGF